MAEYKIGQRYRGSGITMPGIAGETLPRGAAAYMSAVDGLWYLADSDAAATLPAVGIISDGGATGQVIQILVLGMIERSDWTWTRGDTLYISGTAGVLTQTAPANAQPFALALTATLIFVNPTLSGIALNSQLTTTDSQAEVYSTDGGTTFEWATKDGLTYTVQAIGITDPVLAIEAAWAWLNTQGGGTLRTRGPGETWVFQTVCNSQGSNITWLSDWGLTLQAAAAFDDDMIYCNNHDDLLFYRLHLDGNKANQTGGTPDGILVVQSDRFKLIECYIHDCVQAGFQCNNMNQVQILNNTLIDNGWNGLTIGRLSVDVEIAGNWVEGSSDVGISIYGSDIRCHDNDIVDIDGTDGSVDSHWGIGLEGSVQGDANDVHIYNNEIKGTDVPFAANLVGALYFEDIQFNDNVIQCGNSHAIRFLDYVVNFQINDNFITGLDALMQAFYFQAAGNADGEICNNVLDGAATYRMLRCDGSGDLSDTLISGNKMNGTPGVCIQLDNDSDDNVITDNYMRNAGTGVLINAATCANNKVLDNHMQGTTTPLNDSGTDTIVNTITVPFVKEIATATWATAVGGAGVGIVVNAATEGGLTMMHMPEDLAASVYLEVWGVAGGANAAGMMLELAARAAASNEPTGNEQITIANWTSETLNFAGNDVIFWRCTATDDSDMDDLRRGDDLQVIVLHDVASNGDIATDVTLRSVVLGYVT